VSVGNPEVAELLGADDLDLHAARAEVLDSVADEAPGSVFGKARIRRRENGDSH
jgi:hypothetical protein